VTSFRHILRTRAVRLSLTVLTLLVVTPHSMVAHEVPERVAIIAFVKPEGHVLHVVLRVPLESMRDMEFPFRRDGALDVPQVVALLPDAATLWIANYVEFFEDGARLANPRVTATALSLPTDRSFASFDSARAHVRGPALVSETELRWQQALFDIELEYTIASDSAHFSVRPALAHLGVHTTTVLRFLAPGHPERVFEYVGNPGLVALDPQWYQAAWRFVQLGFEHILSGYDHRLFIFCLVIPVRRWRALAAIITAFTAAHSITLVASAYGFAPGALWFPPFIEAAIALSIVFMALENILGRPERLVGRWKMAFAFGLVHGFGFSFALQKSLQFAGAHLVWSLGAFNVGVELGQLFVLALTLPLLALLIRYAVSERATVIVCSALVAHAGWHWMTERVAVLAEYRVSWPVLDAVFLLGVLRILLVLAIAVTVAWLLSGVLERLARAPAHRPVATPGSRSEIIP
jgi:hypothetical protein